MIFLHLQDWNIWDVGRVDLATEKGNVELIQIPLESNFYLQKLLADGVLR